MKLFIVLLLITLLQSCSVGSYYVYDGSDKLASSTIIHQEDGLNISFSFFDGKSSSLFLSSEFPVEVEIDLQKLDLSIIVNGRIYKEEIQSSHTINKISFTGKGTQLIFFNYSINSKPNKLVQNVGLEAKVNGKSIKISEHYNLASKSYSWLEATSGI